MEIRKEGLKNCAKEQLRKAEIAYRNYANYLPIGDDRVGAFIVADILLNLVKINER